MTPTLTITHADQHQLSGFRYFWWKWVHGFNPNMHCARCLLGAYSAPIHKALPLNCPILLDPPIDYSYAYLCGVSPTWKTNLHIAMVPSEDSTIAETTYNGLDIQITGFRRVPIPALPRGFEGRSSAFTTCRNYQFGVAYFGAPVDTHLPSSPHD